MAWRPFLGVEGISSLTGVGRTIHHITGQNDLPGKEMPYAYDVKKCFQTHEAILNPRLRALKATQVRAEKKPKESSSWYCPSQWSSLSVTVALRQAHEKRWPKRSYNIKWHHPGCWGKTEAGPAIPRALKSELLKPELAPATGAYQVLQVISPVKEKHANC